MNRPNSMGRSGGHYPLRSKGVYFALIGGNQVMHFGQSYWRKLVRGAIKVIMMLYKWPIACVSYIDSQHSGSIPRNARVACET